MMNLQKEVSKYENIKKKYAKARNAVSWISGITSTLSAGLSAAGLGTALTGPGAIVGIPMGVLDGVCGFTTCLGNFVSKKLANKISKHDKTIVLAKSKIYSIQDLVNKAIEDGNIEEKESGNITKEAQKHEIQKSEIRKKCSSWDSRTKGKQKFNNDSRRNSKRS